MTETETSLAPATSYVQNLRAGRFTYQRCVECERPVFYPRMLCPHCGGTELGWHDCSGEGTVYSVTAITQRDAEPYNVVLVDLADGFRMMSTVVGSPADEVTIGAPVRAQIEDGEEQPRVVFRLSGAS